jgi:gliding motility-associated-like protein
VVPAYIDKGLTNGLEYCFKIKAVGNYSAGGFVDPIINLSQELCAVPVDNQPPCPPELTVVTDCDALVNRLAWRIPSDTCPGDIAGYYLYYAIPPLEPSIIDSLNRPFDTVYIHKPEATIVGCYYIVAYDSTGNRSEPGNTVCIDLDACPSHVYRLPNIFTPNDDGHNDLFIPFPYTSVERIELTVIDRWGREVFTTEDPAILWDGRDKTTGQPCSDGTYFYLCDVYEITLQGTIMRTLRGHLTLLR